MTEIVRVTETEITVVSAGEAGPPGPAGPVGPSGGPQGNMGPPGVDGEDGEQGPQGEPGRDGRDGVDGLAGPPGLDGEDGEAGPPGAPGRPGFDGQMGPPGMDGEEGEPGIPGAEGPRGPIGFAGASGPPGLDGEDGEVGPPGAPGRPGFDGQMGPPGMDGEDGLDGQMGPPGRDGRDGVDGLAGPPGLDGEDGEAGPPGPPGRPGFDGQMGPPGMDGDEGEMGIPGTPAAPTSAIRRPPDGRLTLTSGTPVMSAAVLAATSVFYAPYVGDLVPIWDGGYWTMEQFAELTLALGNNGTNPHAASTIFDLFVIKDAGTMRLGTGPAWTSDTARGAGAGTTELARRNGILVNAASLILKFGSASGNEVTVPVNQATYVGTMRTTATAAQTEFSFGGLAAGGTAANLFLWNAYHRKSTLAVMRDTTNSWTYAAAAWRASNNSTGMRANYVTGLQEDAFIAINSGRTANGLLASGAAIGVGDNVVSTFIGISQAGETADAALTAVAQLVPPIGFRFLSAIEFSGAGTNTFHGDDADPAFNQQGLHVTGWF